MSAYAYLADLLSMPVPTWAVLLVLPVLGAVHYLTALGKLRSHGRILGHLDRWANGVERRLDRLGQGMDEVAPAPAREWPRPRHAPRPRVTGSSGEMSSAQVNAVIARIIGTSAA